MASARCRHDEHEGKREHADTELDLGLKGGNPAESQQRANRESGPEATGFYQIQRREE
ncbi:MAG: hypothetical protein M3Q30_12760 [Actinomycetota bacterium]|nr:hypothetical protein [Actinomycetota bacterium]